MRLTPGVSWALTAWSRVKARFLFGLFFSRMCDFIPCRRVSLPVPVSLKRFLAPEWVFCLGMGVVRYLAASGGFRGRRWWRVRRCCSALASGGSRGRLGDGLLGGRLGGLGGSRRNLGGSRHRL